MKIFYTTYLFLRLLLNVFILTLTCTLNVQYLLQKKKKNVETITVFLIQRVKRTRLQTMHCTVFVTILTIILYRTYICVILFNQIYYLNITWVVDYLTLIVKLVF